MKINEVSSNPRSKTEEEVGAQDRSGFDPSAASTIRRRARRAKLGRCTATGRGTRNSPRAEADGEKSRGGPEHLRDVKNEGTSGDVYENKGPYDNLPDTKGDICARLHAILHRKTRILHKS